MKIVYILTNNAEPDEMTLYASFHLGLHCFEHSKYMFKFMREKKLTILP